MHKIFKAILIFNFSLLIINSVNSQFTKQDTLRGSNGQGRDWWDVMRYNIAVEPDYNTKTIKGETEIEFAIKHSGSKRKMQIDLQQPLIIDSIKFAENNKWNKLQFSREGNVYFIDFGKRKFSPLRPSIDKTEIGVLPQHRIIVYYHGKPREAIRPPWDGGWIFTKDAQGRPWMSVACQGLGASVWYPCKDYQGDEPDFGAQLQMIIADTLIAVGNDRK